jgi:hypothetical protein
MNKKPQDTDDSATNKNKRAPRLLYQLVNMERNSVPLTPNEHAALEQLRRVDNMPSAAKLKDVSVRIQQEGDEAEDKDDDISVGQETTTSHLTRQDLLRQLHLAKQLRRRLEENLARAEDAHREEPEIAHMEARRILWESGGDLCELAALQDAVEGGFALKSYDHYKLRFQASVEHEESTS